MASDRSPAGASTVDDEEVARFAALAGEWWDPRGKMAPLHKFNPVRLGYIRDAACRRFGRDPKRLDCLAGLRVLDIGCGGGILSEPLARLGAEMVGAHPAQPNIPAAPLHAAHNAPPPHHRAPPPAAPAQTGQRLHIALALEEAQPV